MSVLPYAHELMMHLSVRLDAVKCHAVLEAIGAVTIPIITSLMG